MFSIMSAGASGLQSQNLWLNAISTNIANNQTPGFGERLTVLGSSPGNVIRPPGTVVGNQVIGPPLALTPGTSLAQDAPVFSNQATHTSHPHDVAILGPGFLTVQTAGGSLAYTRAGTLQVDSQGHLTVAGGYQISPPITIPVGASWHVSSHGRILVSQPGLATRQAGQLTLALIPNPAGLLGIGHNLYSLSAASGAPIIVNPGQKGAGLLQPGSLNASGVDMASALTDLIQAQGAYQMTAKILAVSQSLDKGLSQIIT